MIAPGLVGGHTGLPRALDGLQRDLLLGCGEVARARQPVVANDVGLETQHHHFQLVRVPEVAPPTGDIKPEEVDLAVVCQKLLDLLENALKKALPAGGIELHRTHRRGESDRGRHGNKVGILPVDEREIQSDLKTGFAEGLDVWAH